jgi:hypothetical protein
MLKRFKLVSVLLLAVVTPVYAADAPGVTKTEIKIGATFRSVARLRVWAIMAEG